MMVQNWLSAPIIGISVALLLFGASRCSADEADNFYAGKQISLVLGTAPGGGNDLYGRILAQFLGRHIRGNPTIVVQNMPGSGGVTAATYMYNIAAKDGTVIALCPASMLLAEALKPGKVHFQSANFSWIGTIATTTDLLAVFKSTGVNKLDDAKHHEVAIGASGEYTLSSLEPAITNALLGTKFKIVRGYSGGGDALNLAMERHEIEGRTNQWASWKVLRPEWIRDHLLSYLVQYGPRDPDIPNSVPTMGDLVTTADAKAMIHVLELPQYMGRSIFAPPGVSQKRLDTLAQAFGETMKDPAFVKMMRERNLELYPEKGSIFHDILMHSLADRDKTVSSMKMLLDLK